MPTGDNPHSISEKKAALRESPKEPKSIVNTQSGTSSFLKDKAVEIAGIKRPQSNGPSSPTNTLAGSGASGHLVYVRRKLETEQNKLGTFANAEGTSSPDSKKTVLGGLQEQTLKPQNNVPHVRSAPAFASTTAAPPALPSGGLLPPLSFGKQPLEKTAGQPSNVLTTSPIPHNTVSTSAAPSNVVSTSPTPCHVMPTTPTHDFMATRLAPNPADPPRSSNQDWKERFIRLQAFLRNNEQSGQEEYIRMLRSLSSVGRSRHAIELEKRAVNLLIEEGKELQKMKVLNVLGRLSPTEPPLLPTQSSPMPPPFHR